MNKFDFNKQLSQKAQLVNEILQSLLKEQSDVYDELYDALKYVLEGKGKRIRGALVLWSCEVVSGNMNRDAEIAAAAIEMIHAYSLVHDDLPSMDNDDIRRGRATCHKAFDEATAILAGDGLLTLAFEFLAKEIEDSDISIKLISQMAEAAGPSGMIAGQMADLKAEKMYGDIKLLEYIHTNKTAKIFQCAAIMGAVTGKADTNQLRTLSEYGLKIGLGFQISDDILDISASSEQLGKTAGKDAKADKMTYPSLMGLEKSKELARQKADEAIAVLEPFGDKAKILRDLATALLERTR